MATDYTEIARKQIIAEEAARAAQAVTDRANALREADARAEVHLRLCLKHGRDPAKTPMTAEGPGVQSPPLALDEIAYENKLRDYLVSNAGTAAWIPKTDEKGAVVKDHKGQVEFEHVSMHHTELLSPSIVTDPVRQAKIAEIRARLVRKFETEVYPAEVAARQQASDGLDSATQARAHNMVAA